MNVRKFGKYEIIEKIGQGGMGEVFKARDPVLKRDVAVKTVSAGVSGDDDLRQRFEREAQLAAGLNHPNIVHIYDFGEEGGKIYMAMELLLGKDLKAAIKGNLLPTLDDKLALMEDVCEGLAFAHYREIVHRDLKPANIHIQPDGRAKIMDFGLAKLESSDMTRTGVIMGTPDYMAPEQVQGGKADPRSDVYSLGAVFYELLTGRRPFQAESTHALLFQVLYNQPEPITKLQPDLPSSVVQIVERAMSKDPAQRFQNGGDMRDTLRRARAALKTGDSDATLIADVTLAPQTPVPGFAGPTTPHPSSWPQSGPPGGGPPLTPRTSPPGTPVPMSGGISAYPHTATPAGGPASRGSAAPGSVMTPGSQGYGSFSQPTIVVQKSYAGLFVGLGVAVLAIGAVVLYGMGMLPGFPRQDSAAAAQVSQLQQDLLSRDLDSAAERLRRKDFDGAQASVERVLGKDPANGQGLEIQRQIDATLSNLEKRAGEARAAIERGDHAGAAAIVAGMLEVHPSFGPALNLSNQLDEHFRGQAGSARSEMEQSRRRATEAGATSLSGFVVAASVAGEALALYEQGSFVQSAGKFRAATEGFEAARREATRLAQQKPAPPEPVPSSPPPPDPTEAESARQDMGRARRQADATEGAAALGSYVVAAGLAREGEALFLRKDYGLAAAKFSAAAEGFEAARREATRLAQQKPAPPDPVPVSIPAPQPVAPPVAKPVDETAAIRDVVRKYEEVFEKKDLGLYEQIKPNVSAKEIEGLQRVLERVSTYDVALEISSIDVQGSEATVGILRQDTIDGKSRPRISQTLYLTKSAARGWIIERLGQ